jgi:hypothetical protein
MKLHAILAIPELRDIVAWDSHGRSFRILKARDFEQLVLPKYFGHSKFSSFTRQVNGWSFRSLSDGENKGSYYEPYFLRNMPWLVKKMRRPKRGEKKTLPKEYEPDLVAINKEFPLPNYPESLEVQAVLKTIKKGAKAPMPEHWYIETPIDNLGVEDNQARQLQQSLKDPTAPPEADARERQRSQPLDSATLAHALASFQHNGAAKPTDADTNANARAFYEAADLNALLRSLAAAAASQHTQSTVQAPGSNYLLPPAVAMPVASSFAAPNQFVQNSGQNGSASFAAIQKNTDQGYNPNFPHLALASHPALQMQLHHLLLNNTNQQNRSMAAMTNANQHVGHTQQMQLNPALMNQLYQTQQPNRPMAAMPNISHQVSHISSMALPNVNPQVSHVESIAALQNRLPPAPQFNVQPSVRNTGFEGFTDEQLAVLVQGLRNHQGGMGGGGTQAPPNGRL